MEEKKSKEVGTEAIVKLNIGGIKYCTTKSTLTHFTSSNFFSSLLSGDIPRFFFFLSFFLFQK